MNATPDSRSPLVIAPPVIAPPVIVPVADPDRPLWSVMIPTYNCARQAAEALTSVLCQAPGPDRMEIVVVDDASIDDITDVVARHEGRVRLHRQPINLGVPGNLNAALQLSLGRIVHLLHGDDLVEPGFYEAMEEAFTDKAAGAAYCRHIFIDQDGREVAHSALELVQMGRLPDALGFLAAEQRIMTPSICVRREAYERLGGFHPALHCAEDWEMWVRIARDYPIVYVPQPLARYRMQANSNTGRNVSTARDVAFNGIAIEMIRGHLPADIAGQVATRARHTYARSALETAKDCARRGDVSAALAQLRGALRLSRSAGTLIAAARTLVRIVAASLWRRSAV